MPGDNLVEIGAKGVACSKAVTFQPAVMTLPGPE